MRLVVWLDQVKIKQTSFLTGVDFRFEFEIDNINSWVGVALIEQSLFILFGLCLALFRVEVKFKNFLETKLYRLSILVLGPFFGSARLFLGVRIKFKIFLEPIDLDCLALSFCFQFQPILGLFWALLGSYWGRDQVHDLT